jgi:hypothetical protein
MTWKQKRLAMDDHSMVTSLPPDPFKQRGMTPAQDIDEALRIADLQAGSLIYVVPYGGTTLLGVAETNGEI